MNRRKTIRVSALVVVMVAGMFAPQVGAWPPVPAEDLAKIEAAVPEKARVEPRKPRKVLVFSLEKGNHEATPHGAKALELMGRKTGAFEVVHSSDPTIFKAQNLRPFDAVVFNNCNRMTCFKDGALREGLLSFVHSGKGFVGIHAAATNFIAQWGTEWPGGAELVGGVFDGHPWHEPVTIRVEEPSHPLTAAFAEGSLEISDEIYQFAGPYSRDRVRVLVSLDKEKSDMSPAKRAKIRRKDLDFPVSWIQRFGRGRVFYCSLGHDPHVFWNPQVLQHYLDGIQFAVGDLDADTRPSAIVARERANGVVRSDAVSLARAPWGTLQWLVSGAGGTSRKLTLGRVAFKPGESNPAHSHPNAEEILYVASGVIEHSLPDGKTTVLREGDCIVIAPNVKHNAKNVGDGEAVVIVVYSTAFREIEH